MTQTKEETKELEIEENKEGQESALDALLSKVDLDSPLQVEDGHGNRLLIPKEQFIKYYLPKDATMEEAYHCFNQTKAAGLSPLIAGECHYPRFGDGPLRLFTGYPVYLRKAYENGLEHLSYEFTEDDSGRLISVITTFDIKGRDKPFVWETWYDEVVGMTKGKVNWRWQKAPRSQLRKCGSVDGLRYSGLLAHMNLPYIMEERGDPTVEGFRTLTQAQLEGYEENVEQEPPEIESVSATHHQIDMTPFRKKYFGMLKTLGMSWTTDEPRHHWQKQELGISGNGSVANLTVEEWSEVFVTLAGMIAEHEIPGPGTPGGGGLSDQPRYHKDKPGEMIGAKTEAELQAEADSGDNGKITPATRKHLSETVKTFPGAIYRTIVSSSFRERAARTIKREISAVSELTEAEAWEIIASLNDEKMTVKPETGATFAADNEKWFRSPERAMAMGEYNGRIRDKFTSPEEIPVWQEEHTGVATTSRWYQEHFDKANATLDREEKIEQAAAEARAEVLEQAQVPLDEDGEPLEDGMMTPEDAKAEAERQAEFEKERERENAELETEREQLRDQFMELLIQAFPNLEDRYTWIAQNIPGAAVNQINIWPASFYEQGIELLEAVQGGAGNNGGVKGSAESEKQQEGATVPAEPTITNPTKRKIGRLIKEWPKTPYSQTIRTQTFRKRAEKEIGAYDDINNVTEEKGLQLLAALTLERESENQDDPADALGPDIPLIQQFKDKAILRFTPADSSKFVEWKRANGLDGVKVGEWDDDTAKRGIALLEGVPLLEEAKGIYINQGQRDQIVALVKDMPERFHGSTGSESFRTWVSEIIKEKYAGLPQLTETQASDVIHQMQDMVEAEGRRKEKTEKSKADMFS